MTWTRTTVSDTPEQTTYRETESGTGATRTWSEPKPGSRGANEQALRDRMESALAAFESNYANWASLTAAQKDTANRNAQRAAAALIRLLLGRLEAN